MAEVGYADVLVDQWVGFLAPAGTPRSIIDRLSVSINDAVKDPDVQEVLQSRGMVVEEEGTSDSFGNLIKSDLDLWKKVVVEVGIKIQ